MMSFALDMQSERRMDLKQLTALVTVAEAGSVTKAARLLFLVQPAVTRQIRTLEQEIGVPLFERTRSGMVPTPEGALLVERARRALRELERARAEIRPDPGFISGVVTFGVLESAIDLIVPALIDSVAEKFPGITLRILTAYSGHLQQWLDEGALDVSLLYNLATAPPFAVVPLVHERLWGVAPPGSGLDPATPLPWETLLEHPLILPMAGHGLRTLIDRARPSAGGDPDIAYETNSMHVQKHLVLAGRGWSILPAVGVAADVSSGLLEGAPVTRPDVVRSVVLGLPRATRTPPATEAVAKVVIELVREFTRSGAWPSAWLSTDEDSDPQRPGKRRGSPSAAGSRLQ